MALKSQEAVEEDEVERRPRSRLKAAAAHDKRERCNCCRKKLAIKEMKKWKEKGFAMM